MSCSVSATRQIRNTGFLNSSSNSICHSAFSESFREMSAIMSPQTPVISFQAAL